ncbi:hypothetical protein FALBO_3450 [Fusarium albosuccineum]|uniref:Uncharacterized protein n=1 Tax=Fusarium albosuccineum TaxID=1237068 RepID=A0A8H4PL57_9HYPO|nr:hypothetical protein FALBO_3450 [Fusarium albosuccineum]
MHATAATAIDDATLQTGARPPRSWSHGELPAQRPGLDATFTQPLLRVVYRQHNAHHVLAALLASQRLQQTLALLEPPPPPRFAQRHATGSVDASSHLNGPRADLDSPTWVCHRECVPPKSYLVRLRIAAPTLGQCPGLFKDYDTPPASNLAPSSSAFSSYASSLSSCLNSQIT